MNESNIKNNIMRLCGSGKIRLFTNPVGNGFQGEISSDYGNIITLRNIRRIRFGLHPGSSDLIGWKSVEITADMIGKKIAQFVAIEVKSERGFVRPEQTNFVDQVNRAGGIGAIVRSAEEAHKAINAERAE